MSRYIRKIGPKAWWACGLALWFVALVGVKAHTPTGPAVVTPVAEKLTGPPKALQPERSTRLTAQSPQDYVGEDTCLTCHEAQAYKGTLHALKSNPRTPAATHGCESCHGPGKGHVDGSGDKTKIINPKKVEAREASEICTTCHDRAKHALWDGSQHDQRNVSCITCHSTHSPKGTEAD